MKHKNMIITEDTFEKTAQELVSQMTLEEKAGMCSGLDCWNTKPVERLGVPSLMVSDGPHGLRKQNNAQDNLGIGESVPATCFPTASLSACSFDPELIEEMGRSIGTECLKENVGVILGPGINMKRSPLCGRNFEYFSEDPYLSGKLASSYIKGVQSTGVGTSLKHFALNSQERRRMNVNAVADERTLREIYLKAFEIAVKEAAPKTVMCSYNKVNGTYSSENKRLLTDILRNEWGYKGLVVSDWGAVHLRAEGIEAGLDLEMPGSNGINDAKIVEAASGFGKSDSRGLDNGDSGSRDSHSEVSGEENLKGYLQALNNAAVNVTKLALEQKEVLKKSGGEKSGCDLAENHRLAVKIATESMVLLKNEDSILPLKQTEKEFDGQKTESHRIAVIGEFAVTPRYQGAGSSKINPIKVDSPFDALEKAGVKFEYAKGYEKLTGKQKNNHLLEEAVRVSAGKEVVVVFAGLTERYESEGFDRADMRMPQNQNELIEEIYKVNKNIVVVLMGGAPIELPWEDKAKAILLSYLGGEGVGTAVANLLTGKNSPCGKLAETWPLCHKDAPCEGFFPGDRLNVLYPENIFIGYRYYDSWKVKPRYLFGHGLSYSTFEYKEMSVEAETKTNKYRILVKVKNVGDIKAKETVLVFAEHSSQRISFEKHRLVAFKKEEFEPGEEKNVELEIDVKDLMFYNVKKECFSLENGEYTICAGRNLEDLPLSYNLVIEDGEEDFYDSPKELLVSENNLKPHPFSEELFETLLGRKLPEKAKPARRPFTMENCLEDTETTGTGRFVLKLASIVMKKMSSSEENQDQMMLAAIKEMPFFALYTSSGGMISENQMKGILDILNGHFFRGVFKALKK